ncbi:hypothetical protein HDU77_009399 [Chytriomyces hyalinus]|nr:hypothetical protein HDU77_009399 [Chytriomyces hyalinus]
MESRQFDLIILILSIVSLAVQSGACAYRRYQSVTTSSTSSKAGRSSGGYAVSSIMLYSLLEHRLYLLMSTSSVRQRNRTCLFSLIAVLGLVSVLASVLQTAVSIAVLWLTASSVKSLVEGLSHAGSSVGVYRVIFCADAVRFFTVLLVNVVLFWDEWGGPRVILLDTVKMGITSLCIVAPTATSLQRLFSRQMQQTDGLPMGSVVVALSDQKSKFMKLQENSSKQQPPLPAQLPNSLTLETNGTPHSPSSNSSVAQLSCNNLATSTADPRFDETTELDTLTAENAQLNLRVKELERQRTIESAAFKSALRDLERENEWLREKMTSAETKWMNAVCNLSTAPLERVDAAKRKPVDDKIEDQQLRDPYTSLIERWRNAIESLPIQPQSQSKKRLRVTEHFKLDVDETQIPSQPILPQLGHSAAKPKPKQLNLDDFASKNVNDAGKEDAASPVSVHGSMAAMLPEGEEEVLEDENQQPNKDQNEAELESFTLSRKSIIPTPRSNQTLKKSRETFKIPSSSKPVQKSSAQNRMSDSSGRQSPAEPKAFQYQEVVRGKAERRQLHGASCPCCNDFFDAVGDVPPIRDLGQPEVAVKNSHLNNVSRHRSKWQVPDTPDGFWDVGFPSTAEMDKRSERRKSGGV